MPKDGRARFGIHIGLLIQPIGIKRVPLFVPDRKQIPARIKIFVMGEPSWTILLKLREAIEFRVVHLKFFEAEIDRSDGEFETPVPDSSVVGME